MQETQLQKFKNLLEQRLEKIESEIKNLQNELEELANYDSIDDLEDLSVIENINDDDKALLQKLLYERKSVKKALKKIETGEYGKCSDGSEIPLEVLEANPLHEC
ncbi:hypothetical protein [Nitratiruptor sp. YY09-18]|uniref:TraR/DksA family transcriptional regulator n=1 Tax=Nitratiruptor sp. YY09-18 TaxID=2724901 RepID=UPI001915204C|nr:hypothetical protein [Nitratiruptor sp. YY09-18]BCD68274.1 DnaK suppressor protein [Nitratiruptor sp. YY09-18]